MSSTRLLAVRHTWRFFACTWSCKATTADGPASERCVSPPTGCSHGRVQPPRNLAVSRHGSGQQTWPGGGSRCRPTRDRFLGYFVAIVTSQTFIYRNHELAIQHTAAAAASKPSAGGSGDSDLQIRFVWGERAPYRNARGPDAGLVLVCCGLAVSAAQVLRRRAAPQTSCISMQTGWRRLAGCTHKLPGRPAAGWDSAAG